VTATVIRHQNKEGVVKLDYRALIGSYNKWQICWMKLRNNVSMNPYIFVDDFFVGTEIFGTGIQPLMVHVPLIFLKYGEYLRTNEHLRVAL
jgi:hypothetical protein